ncbi:hypothetical protein [Bradyrhizobium elkanii]|uniref:hypothetical protein n=1 Tax=Bradyrhizobium elkanii TaxID=29448 RepID=UPI0020A12CBE|nr:hypothetical protein [Bradyrhizobium elkanii]MCP1926400.1 hypothetical protein [Bradyrhizobium elkanii]
MPRSQSQKCPLTEVLKERFKAGTPPQDAFISRIASYFQALPSELRGRVNRTAKLHTIKKNTRRWLRGSIPEEGAWPAIANALGLSEEEVAQLCRPQRVQQPPSIYRFSSPPLAVIAAWQLEDGVLTAHPDDQRAFEILEGDIAATGVALGAHMLSREPGCPTSCTNSDLILIGGPNNNPPATQLNSFIAKSGLSAFYFASVIDIPSPDVRRNDWLITHTKIGLRVAVTRKQSRAKKEDYGIIYVGSNPEASGNNVIWLAGLHSKGTIGAASAFLEADVRTHILEEFNRGKKHVSAIVRFDWSENAARRVVEVLYA